MYSLLSHNTFGIDVYAERFQEYASVEELKTLIAQGALTTPFLHIGGGSNLLFVKDYEGLVLHSRCLLQLACVTNITTLALFLTANVSCVQTMLHRRMPWRTSCRKRRSG